MAEQGVTWIGRRPLLAIPLIIAMVPLYVLIGSALGVWEVFSESWWPDFKMLWRNLFASLEDQPR